MTAPAPLPRPIRTSPPRRGLRIAMIAPPYYTLPPDGYGGVEQVAADLVDALVDRGHHVTLFGAGKHTTRAQEFQETFAEPPSDRLGQPEPEVTHAAIVADLLSSCAVDVIHDHTLAGPLLARGRRTPTVVTMHGPSAGPERDYYRALGDTVHLVAVSAAQRIAAPELAWLATVHNGIRVDTFPYREDKDDFALFLGRFHPDKAAHLAIDAARAAGRPIVLAGKCSEPVEEEYFEREIEPRLGPDVSVHGVADADEKRDLLSRASCLAFPIQWEEPFGLVMIEAMACGTPVAALRRGSVPEVVTDGRTGVIVDDPADLAEAIRVACTLNPADCRKDAERRFTTVAMAAKYEAAYHRVLSVAADRPYRDSRLTAVQG